MKAVSEKFFGRIRRVLYGSVLILCAVFAAAGPMAAQDDDPIEGAPPPEVLFSIAESDQLAKAKDLRARTRLAIELMDARLKAAERHSSNSNFDAVFAELGPFHALVLDGIEYLEKQDLRSKSVLDNLKRFEIGIRGFFPRLELLRRSAPTDYEPYIRRLIRVVREARSRALDPMFSEAIVPIRRPN
ncbi:MAG: hypothetical protein KF881_05420 [Acidobacteria bacterium]|nr:hypothetical protein [Acidobacteriota bacterium]